MSSIRSNINPEALHHAYVLAHGQTPREEIEKELFDYVEETFGMRTVGNSNIFRRVYENLGVDEVKELLSFASYVAMADESANEKNVLKNKLGKVASISVRGITHGAQNALLKMLEDPVGKTTFFVLIPSRASLLPTFLSRVMLIDVSEGNASGKENKKADKDALVFLSASTPKRLDMVKAIVDEENKDLSQGFILNIEDAIYSLMPKIKDQQKAQILQTLQSVDEYKHDTSASLKMMLEYLALNLPVLE